MVTTQNARLELIYREGIRSKSGRGKWGDRLLPKHNHTKGQDIWKKSVMSEGCDWAPHNAGLADDKMCSTAQMRYNAWRWFLVRTFGDGVDGQLCYHWAQIYAPVNTTHVAIYGYAFEWRLVQRGQHLSLIGTRDVKLHTPDERGISISELCKCSADIWSFLGFTVRQSVQ